MRRMADEVDGGRRAVYAQVRPKAMWHMADGAYGHLGRGGEGAGDLQVRCAVWQMAHVVTGGGGTRAGKLQG